MLEELLRTLKNYFIREVYVGKFSIESGTISVDFLQNGQYFKIHGSVFNDGVYQYPIDSLTDEEFTGEIWAMAVPSAVIALSEEIADWNAKNADVLSSPYLSESFGGYSYSKATSTTGSGASVPATWKEAFATRLNSWRKIQYESSIRRYDYVRHTE